MIRQALAVCVAMLMSMATAQADGMRLWQEGDALLSQQGEWKAGVGWKLTSADSSTRLHGWELKPKLQRRLSSWLDAAATYKFARGRAADDSWTTAHTLELDLAMSGGLGPHNTQLTHRLGIVNPAAGGVLYRYHSIPKIDWRPAGLAEAWSMDSVLECIYDFRQSTWIETKLTPLRLKRRADGGGTWSLAYLLNHKRPGSSEPWHRDHVIVLAVTLDLT
ncbi:hypothetical protein [Steroidobacter sp.]|uniref:hypothetical protein n=1 Tax=Steroidobacter sp. TaxID=1978227 RepID=UPI001A640FF9|nr:hypothetical protein [Steroidobacter sp.]MBL8269347.1 hypothetical protein [Steroidobacter sp.]